LHTGTLVLLAGRSRRDKVGSAGQVKLDRRAARNHAEKIKSAMAAGPAAITSAATVMDVPSMKVLKQGTNGWTCVPDGPYQASIRCAST
jgi:hypothetical protein